MCDAIEYIYNGDRLIATAGARGSRLPVRLRSGGVLMVLWGAQGRQFYGKRETRVVWPDEPAVPLRVLRAKAWADFAPRPVNIPASRVLVAIRIDDIPLGHWIKLRRGEYVQGALLECEGELAVYVVCVDPPPEYDSISAWPRVVAVRRGNTRR